MLYATAVHGSIATIFFCSMLELNKHFRLSSRRFIAWFRPAHSQLRAIQAYTLGVPVGLGAPLCIT
jgi:hypothetical protein